MKPSAQSDENKIHAGTILTSFGIRYKSYCSNLSRTILINPEKQKETDYKFLLELHKHVLGFIKPGVACNDIYSAAVKYVAEKRPDLSSNLVKNIGFGIGIEFRDSTFLLNSKNTRKLVAGMALNLNLGFQGIEVPEAKDPKAKVNLTQ